MTSVIHISSAQRKILSTLFEQYLPGVLVWVFGSRVKGNFRPDSDLDLVVFSKVTQSALVSSLREHGKPLKTLLKTWVSVLLA